MKAFQKWNTFLSQWLGQSGKIKQLSRHMCMVTTKSYASHTHPFPCHHCRLFTSSSFLWRNWVPLLYFYLNTINLFLMYFLYPRKNSIVSTPTISLTQALPAPASPHPRWYLQMLSVRVCHFFLPSYPHIWRQNAGSASSFKVKALFGCVRLRQLLPWDKPRTLRCLPSPIYGRKCMSNKPGGDSDCLPRTHFPQNGRGVEVQTVWMWLSFIRLVVAVNLTGSHFFLL